MDAVLHCKECDIELPEETPTGLCAECERKSAAGETGADVVSSQMPTLKSRPRHQAPNPDEIAGHFPQLEIIGTLGQGGMGVVFRARQKALDRLVALKILPREASEQPGFAERFTREGRALARLAHPNIVTVYDSGEIDGLYYFLMEFVDGPSLRRIIAAREAAPEQALNIVSQVCDALEFAHDEGIVHRDIKPENILLDRKGRVKIADFGVAKLLDRKPTDYTLTSADQVMGTPHYMAPEQTERPLDVDHRADIYAVGVVFYELLCGDLPLGRFPLPSEKLGTDSRLDEIVLRTLAKSPDERFQKATDLRTAVESLTGTRIDQTKYQVARRALDPSAVSTTAPTIATPGPSHPSMSGLHPTVDFELAYAKVNTPATLMFFFSVCSFVIMGIGAIGMLISFLGNQSDEGVLFTTFIWFAAAGGSFLIMLGAQRMKRLESYRMAQTAAILSMTPVPATCWFPFLLFIGIWAILVLNRRDVAAAFEVKKRGMQAQRAAGRTPK